MLTCAEWWWWVMYGEDGCFAFGLSSMAAFGELEQFQWRGREECLNGVGLRKNGSRESGDRVDLSLCSVVNEEQRNKAVTGEGGG